MSRSHESCLCVEPSWKKEKKEIQNTMEKRRPSSGTIHLSQTKYIKDLHKASMASAKAMPNPMLTSKKLSTEGDAAFSNPSLYRSIGGGLQ